MSKQEVISYFAMFKNLLTFEVLCSVISKQYNVPLYLNKNWKNIEFKLDLTYTGVRFMTLMEKHSNFFLH